MGDKGDWRWWIDTVFVIADSEPYRLSGANRALKDLTSDVFSIVTDGPLSDNYNSGWAADKWFRLYRGTTPDDPVDGMCRFFPAEPAGGSAGFPQPVIGLPSEYFNPTWCTDP